MSFVELIFRKVEYISKRLFVQHLLITISVSPLPIMYQIGVIIGSTRQPRVCPQISNFVINTIEKSIFQMNEFKLKEIDLKDINLPLYDESGIPRSIVNAVNYDHDHTREWSKLISSLDGFIFISPQYNWGYPASLKNAIDYLYHEWSNKPCMLVTYGGHGGIQCDAQLRVVFQGLKMRASPTKVCITFPNHDFLQKASKGLNLSSSEINLLQHYENDIYNAFNEILVDLN